MSLSMDAPNSADLVNIDELVSISMHEMTVVVRPTSRPEALGTQVLVDVVNAATVAGSTVALHRPERFVGSHVAADAPDWFGDDASESDGTEPVAVTTAGVGLVQIRSEGRVWTIDYGSARFVRTDRPIDRRFLAASDWTDFETIWIGPRDVRALTVDGSYVAGRRSSQQPCVREIRDGRWAMESLRPIA